MTASDRPPARRSLILAFWQEQDQAPGKPRMWRFSLEDPRTGQRRAFPTLGALFVALEQELAGEGMADHKPWASP